MADAGGRWDRTRYPRRRRGERALPVEPEVLISGLDRRGPVWLELC